MAIDTTSTHETTATSLLGQTIKGYEIREELGAGSFGMVYKAYQPMVGREVAIKVILPAFANQPEFIRRFEFEAQLVAKLEHIHIVPLYDYWREPSGAYLVMRFLRGGSLRESLNRGAWDLERVARLVDQICSALAAAHRSGVVHRDLKPDNILLDEDGNAYLADFGIAKSLSVGETIEGEAVTGSPAYLSPEQIRGSQVSAQADLYAMGIMIYEMLTGSAPLPNSSTFAEIVSFQLNEALPAVELAGTNDRIVLGVNALIQKATAKDPAERYPDALALARAFREATRIGRKTGPLDSSQLDMIILDLPDFDEGTAEIDLGGTVVNPFKGLRAFQQTDADDFYGREALTEQLANRLKEQDSFARFLAVVGPSGSGKSSVVRAGLLPALRRDILPNSNRWFVVEMIPGPRPLDELEAALTRIAVNPIDAETLKDLRTDPKALLKIVDRCLPIDPKCELLLVIDQFEEVFTLLENEDERLHILNMLLNAVNDPSSRVRLIVT
ncbi:MAG: serine/threonine-protein kinase PknK, partial [Anaerolineae bacterium]|nr:serine/threonine-protein kinase PknK [Anaerolineae bacterium]